MKKSGLLFIVALMAATSGAYAAGLAIPEQGAAAMGMSAAVTARSEDLSALYYNPAGLDYVEKTEVMLGLTPIMPRHTFESNGTSTDAEKHTFVPPQVYLAHRLNKRLVLGFGIFAPYGLGTDWNREWEGRYSSTYGEIAAIYVTPAVSYKLYDWLSIGATYSWIYSDAVIEKMADAGLSVYSAQAAAGGGDPSMVANPEYDTKFKLDGEGGGVAYSFGIMLRPMERMQVGIQYNGRTTIEYEGLAKFFHVAELNPILSASMPYSQDGSAKLDLPSSINLGLLYDLTERWDAEIDLDFVHWSNYKRLTIDLEQNLPADKISSVKNWDDTVVIRAGTSYDFSDITTGRFGFLIDQSPVPDDTFDGQLPDADRVGVSVGFGRTITLPNNFSFDLDASYMFLSFADRDKDNNVGYPDSNRDGEVSDAERAAIDGLMTALGREYPSGNGTYKSHANLFSFSVSKKF